MLVTLKELIGNYVDYLVEGDKTDMNILLRRKINRSIPLMKSLGTRLRE